MYTLHSVSIYLIIVMILPLMGPWLEINTFVFVHFVCISMYPTRRNFGWFRTFMEEAKRTHPRFADWYVSNTYVIFFRDQEVWFAVTNLSLQVMQHNWKENNHFTDWLKDENHLKDVDGLVILYIFRIHSLFSLQVNTYKM